MSASRPRGAGERGQTAIDFVVGMGVFLLAVGFVLMFVPSMFAPFFGGGIGDPVTADRATSYLVEERLAEEDAPVGMLSAEKNSTFFDDCWHENVQEETAWLRDELDVERSIQVEVGNGTCGLETSGSVTVSKRFVMIDGEGKLLRVRLW